MHYRNAVRIPKVSQIADIYSILGTKEPIDRNKGAMKVKNILMTITVLSFLGDVQAQLDTAQLEFAMQNSNRPSADLERDQNRKAPQVLEFLGLAEGMTAMDLIAIGGWYSEVLSYAVGNSGEVIMQNNPGRGVDNNIELITDRLDRRSNITHHIGPVSELPPNSVDFALTALNFHDVYNRSADEAHDRFTQVLDVLKPGGIFGVIDHEEPSEPTIPLCIASHSLKPSNLSHRWGSHLLA